MSWYSVAIAWVVLGLVEVCAMELAYRSSDGGGDGPLSQKSLLSSIGLSAALIVGAPFLLLFAFGFNFGKFRKQLSSTQLKSFDC